MHSRVKSAPALNAPAINGSSFIRDVASSKRRPSAPVEGSDPERLLLMELAQYR